MPALRTNTASGCLREVSRERESERRDGTAATTDFRQLPKNRPEIHHWRFPPISNLHSPGPKSLTQADLDPPSRPRTAFETRGAHRGENLADHRSNPSSR